MLGYIRAALYGPIIWGLQFLIVYASESLFCLHGPGAAAHRSFVGATSLLAAAAVVWVLARQRARGGSDAARTGRRLALLSLVAIAWTALPAVLIASCTFPS